MENISLEQIDLIMQRANVSYSEAKEALERSNGNIVDALLYLEKNNKIKSTQTCCNSSNAMDSINSFIKKLNHTYFTLRKQEQTLVKAPLSIALIALILCFPFVVAALIIALICGLKIDIKGDTSIAQKLNETFNSINLEK